VIISVLAAQHHVLVCWAILRFALTLESKGGLQHPEIERTKNRARRLIPNTFFHIASSFQWRQHWIRLPDWRPKGSPEKVLAQPIFVQPLPWSQNLKYDPPCLKIQQQRKNRHPLLRLEGGEGHWPSSLRRRRASGQIKITGYSNVDFLGYKWKTSKGVLSPP